jgi:microcystin degradation protein MlrC
MKPSELKSFIKDAVREAIQEEIKDILLEAVRSPKAPIQETYQMNNLLQPVNTPTTQSPQKSSADKRAMMESIMGDMRRGQDTLSFNSADARGMGMNQTTLQVTPGMNTAGEGSSLPSGNVGLDMIMGLMKGGK